MRRDELRVRQSARPVRRQSEQIVAVGAVTMQQDNEPASLTPAGGPEGRAGEIDHGAHSMFPISAIITATLYRHAGRNGNRPSCPSDGTMLTAAALGSSR